MTVTAVGDDGKPVDWWFAYKVPKLGKEADSASAVGYEYVYFDARSGAVTRSPYRMDQPQGALYATLSSVFRGPDATTGWILYNDEMPPSVGRIDDGNLGHTKGVLAFDTATSTAFWLLHSWPKYAEPSLPGAPTPLYGQTFLCLSLSLDTANTIAQQMDNHQEPQVYDPRLPASLDKASALYKVTLPIETNIVGDSNVIHFVTAGGMKFLVIAKNKTWNDDFWNDLVGPTLQADMDVETWIRGPIPPILDSDGVHKTFDVKYIDLSGLGAPWAWPETKDHAKWGITTDSDWICVGDINRMISQRQRGGGTIAFQNPTLWQALSKTDLLVAPPGHSRAEAFALITATHQGEDRTAAAPREPTRPLRWRETKSGPPGPV